VLAHTTAWLAPRRRRPPQHHAPRARASGSNQGQSSPQRFGLNPIRDIRVLCPMNRGGVGARSLNIELQAMLNPAGDRKVERFGWTFALGDKVMQIENDYDKEVSRACRKDSLRM
jgi:ATP-dependent exoDNAse (exonuclease V) alpha subunit